MSSVRHRALQPRQQGLQRAFRRQHHEQITALDNEAARFVTAMRQQASRQGKSGS